MEVTTVSPSPASPTEGDNLCEIDVTRVAIDIVTLLTSLCGLAGNGAVLWLLSLKIRNSAIFDLALADFLFLLFTVPSALVFLVEDMSCSPILSLTYVRFLFQLSMVSYFCALFRLAVLNFRKDMTFLIQMCCLCNLPERLWRLVDSVQDWVFFSHFTVIPMVTSLCPSHEQEHCRAALISMYPIILLLFAAPVVISHTILFISAKCGSQEQQQKRRDNIVFIIVLSTLLIGLCNFLQQLGYILVSSHVVFLLICILSSIKPFIYFLAGRCWSPCSMGTLRLSLQRVFDEKKVRRKKKEETSLSDDANTDTLI